MPYNKQKNRLARTSNDGLKNEQKNNQKEKKMSGDDKKNP